MRKNTIPVKMIACAMALTLCLAGCGGVKWRDNPADPADDNTVDLSQGDHTGSDPADHTEDDGMTNDPAVDSEDDGMINDSDQDNADITNFSVGQSGAQILSGTEIAALPSGSWQGAVTFPNWRGYVDDTLALNSMYSFEGWHGQGVLYVSLNEEVTGLSMYVNGEAVDTASWTGSHTYEVDYADVAVDGRNTLQVSGITPSDQEEAVSVYIPYPVILSGTLDDVGISEDSMQLISDIIASDVEYGFPSAQLSVVKDGRLVYENAWGTVNAYLPDGTPNEASAPVTTDTLYDLASVTKMFATNYALQKLVTDEELSLDARIVDYLGDRFVDDTIEIAYVNGTEADLDTQHRWKSELTIRDLLCHQGGFPADPRYFNPNVDAASQKYDKDAVNVLYAGNDGSPATREATIEAICKTPLMYEPGTKTVYSDVDYMILGVVVEQITGQDLDTYLKNTFYTPMGLTHITYNPLQHGFTAEDCAATELNGNTRDGAVTFPGIRTETIQGEVHDEKAHDSMGGISGHAGLFSNASDLAVLASVMLTGGYGNERYFSQNVIDAFTSPKTIEDASWGLGWWREADNQRVWYFGTEAGSNTIGHQGWTGTLVMIDPEENLVMVYLTNKIHSPVTNAAANPNKFDGNWYTSSTLGFVPQIMYMGMDGESVSHKQQLDLLYDMANGSIDLAEAGGVIGTTHPLVKNAESKLAVYRDYVGKYGEDNDNERVNALERRLKP